MLFSKIAKKTKHFLILTTMNNYPYTKGTSSTLVNEVLIKLRNDKI